MHEIHPLAIRVKAARGAFTAFEPLSHTPRRIPTGEDWVIQRVIVEPNKKFLSALDAAKAGVEREDLGHLSVCLNNRKIVMPLIPLMDSFIASEAIRSVIGLDALGRTLLKLREALAESGGPERERATEAIEQSLSQIQAGFTTAGTFPAPLPVNDTDDLWLEPSGPDPVWAQVFGVRKVAIGR